MWLVGYETQHYLKKKLIQSLKVDVEQYEKNELLQNYRHTY